jgi:cytosine/adenosine deaminase-related metal-dependent hydrolase
MPENVNAYILDGRIVTMNGSFDVLDSGRVYVQDERIEAVLPADAPPPDGFHGAPLIRTGGTVYPGLIELHNHLAYNVLPLWHISRRYGNRSQWGGGSLEYRARISGPMGVLGRVAGYIEAVVRYVEAKCLLGGVTTSQGIALYSNARRHYYQGLVRNVEQPGAEDLPAANTRIADVEAQHAPAFLDRLHDNTCLLLHLSEGVDEAARTHFRALRVDERRWAITDALAGIHCAGLQGRDFATLRSRGGTMVWSPLSNLLLYGETADIARAVKERVRIALGSDWSPSGSKNLLGEMKVAWLVAEEKESGLTARDIVSMATINAAGILKWDHALGSIESGKRADLIVVNGRGGDPYEHLLRSRETSITLVVIDGKARCGQPRMMDRLSDGGETLRVGDSPRVLDLKDAAGDAIVGALTLGEATDRLTDGMRRLPELAERMDEPGTAAALLGASSTTEPGAWFLELDHEALPGFSQRPQLPFDGTSTGVFLEPFMAGPLAEILEPLELDPLTVADDGEFFDRLAQQQNVPEYVLRELPPLYGERPRTPMRPAVAASVPSAEGAEGPKRLAEFLQQDFSPLSRADRLLLVDQALVLLNETYVHLELKRSMHAVEPIQRLRLLRHRLQQPTGVTMTDLEFHNEMSLIFASVRDLHTNYLLPSPYRDRTAFLPFLVEEYFDDGEPRYVMTKTIAGFEHPTFVPGVEVLYWNGVPIRRAILANAEVQSGSNRAASYARGLDALTIRPLVRSLPPNEDWVVVTYRGTDGSEHDLRLDWMVWAPPSGTGVDPDAGEASRAGALGYDIQTDAVNQAKKVLFARKAFALEDSTVAPVAVGADDLATSMPTVFRAREVETASGTFAYVRIFTFNVQDADEFVTEFARLVELLPPTGLVVDVRGNGGGLIYAAERLLQVLTPGEIEPSRAQFITTPLMLDLCERHAPSPLDASFDLGPWVPSLRQAVATGAVYSQARPITDPESANARGQGYQGQVVLVTDALCYSATDMFAAGFKDHSIGRILGVADNTGAGGANVWTHELLRVLMDAPHPGEAAVLRNPFRTLPKGAGMRVSVRRTIRVGALDGTPLEDLGVEPDERHEMTRDDVMHGNQDLIDHAGKLLAAGPVHRLEFKADALTDGGIDLAISVKNVDRIDVFVDGRPADSFDLSDGETSRLVRSPSIIPKEIELRGYLGGERVVQIRRSLGV